MKQFSLDSFLKGKNNKTSKTSKASNVKKEEASQNKDNETPNQTPNDGSSNMEDVPMKKETKIKSQKSKKPKSSNKAKKPSKNSKTSASDLLPNTKPEKRKIIYEKVNYSKQGNERKY